MAGLRRAINESLLEAILLWRNDHLRVAGRESRHSRQGYGRALKRGVEDLLFTQQLSVVDIDFGLIMDGFAIHVFEVDYDVRAIWIG